LIMSEGKKEITRREFLKIVGVGVGVGTVWALREPLKKIGQLFEQEENPTFIDVAKNTKVSLDVSGEGSKNITLNYLNSDIDSLRIRQTKGVGEAVPFQKDAKTVRTLGEITEGRLRKVVGKNSFLDKDITVGVYPTFMGFLNKTEGRQDLPDTEDIYALPIIVANMSYLGDKAPSEENKNISTVKDWRNIREFGQGLAVGKLDSDNQFLILGYVCDARAVELN
jgi:hypothetical protein